MSLGKQSPEAAIGQPKMHLHLFGQKDISTLRLPERAVPVSAAIQEVRRQFLETGDPTWLAYVYYGDVNLTVQQQE